MVWHGQPPSVNCPEDVCSKGHDRICVGFPANRLRCKMKNNVRGNLANDALKGKAVPDIHDSGIQTHCEIEAIEQAWLGRGR